MVKVIHNSVCRGVAGRRQGNIKGVVIHNTADNLSATQHMNRLARMTPQQLQAGFAHWFIDESTIIRTEDTYNMAWHTANADGNANYIGYEVCRSTSDTKTFLQAEQNTFKQVAEDLKFYGLPANRNTVRLHREFVATSCPHRSWELHGQSLNAVKDYFISEINKYMEEPNKPVKPANTHYGNIDKFAVGSREIDIEGWFLSTDTNNEVYPYLLFMDGNGKEITRLKAERVLRPDLKAHFPHTANWHKSGFKVKTVTPDILKGKGFRILARMATKPTGEGILYEFYLNGEYSATAKLTAGHIDNVHIDDKHMKISGWHFGDNITKDMHRYLFLLDAKTHVELARVKIDNVARQDVQNVYKQYYLANESGFDVTVDISKLHSRDVKIMTRYATDENGNKTANEKLFDQVYHL